MSYEDVDIPRDAGEPAGGQAYPPWFNSYLERLKIQEVPLLAPSAIKFETALEDTDDVPKSLAFWSSVSAAY